MDKRTKCPVCYKEDIPNFIDTEVVCPCCDTDLSIYRKINALSSNDNSEVGTSEKFNRIFWLISISTITVVILGFSLLLNNMTTKYKTSILELEDSKISIQKDNDSLKSINSNLGAKIKELENKINLPTVNNTYIVKKGDSFCKISRDLYGTEARSNEIATFNNMRTSNIIHIGDTLKVMKR